MSHNFELKKPVECIGEFKPPQIQMPLSEGINVTDSSHPSAPNNLFTSLYSKIGIQGNKWMDLACKLATESAKTGGGPFAAILLQVDDSTNRILRYWTGNNLVTRSYDPTAHAEIIAIRSACASLGVYKLNNIQVESKLKQDSASSHCELYSSCEPCPMCYGAIIWAGISHLYFAATRFDAAAPGIDFSDAFIYQQLEMPYQKRSIEVCQCHSQYKLDAFECWKNSMDKQPY